MDVKQLAIILDTAAQKAVPVEQLSQHPSLGEGSIFNEDIAYEIQAASITLRYERGEKLIGLKMGFTSEAKMQQMGVHDMIWGRLTDSMLLQNGGKLDLSSYIHPRAEPEICFLVKREIDRELQLVEAADYVAGLAAAIEIIDSRYKNFKFSLEDVIADNCSSAALVVGEWQPANTPLSDLSIQLLVDGAIIQQGSSADILGDPWLSFVAATRLATKYGQTIPEGSYIMAGAATPAEYLKKDQQLTAKVDGLGEVGFVVQ